MNILGVGYPYTRPNDRAALHMLGGYFVVPRSWPIKGGAATYRTEYTDRIATTWAPFSHSHYPFIGGLLKGWMPFFPFILWRMKRQHAIDLVFEVHEPTLLTTLLHGLAVKALGLTYVVFSWENIPFTEKLHGLSGAVHHTILRATLWLADGVVCGNERCLNIFRELTRKPIARIPLAGLDVEQFTPPATPSTHTGVSFVFVGAVDRRKGIHILLPAFKELLVSIPDARLTIVGSGTYEKEIASTIAQLQVPVTRIPWADRRALVTILSEGDVFVYPSIPHGGWEEQFGYSMAEASLMQLPVIATRSGSIAGVVQSDKTGILVAPGNIAELAGAMKDLALDPQRRRDYGHAGRAWITKMFSNQAVAAQYRDFFTTVLHD